MDPLITQSEGLTAIDEKYDLNNLETKYQFYLLELLLFQFGICCSFVAFNELRQKNLHLLPIKQILHFIESNGPTHCKRKYVGKFRDLPIS